MLDIHIKMYFWLCASGKCGASEAQLAAEQQPHNWSPITPLALVSGSGFVLACVLFPALAIAVASGRKEAVWCCDAGKETCCCADTEHE